MGFYIQNVIKNILCKTESRVKMYHIHYLLYKIVLIFYGNSK